MGRSIGGVLLLLILLTGCATGSRVKVLDDSPASYVKVLPDRPDETPPVVPPEASAPVPDPDDNDKIEEELPIVPLPEPAEEEAADREAALSMKEALDRVLTWTAVGLREFERGDFEAAHKSLTYARLSMLEIDLPDSMKSEGLGALSGSLPKELRQYDVQAIAQGLAWTIQSGPAEQQERARVGLAVRHILQQLDPSELQNQYLDVLIDQTHHFVNYRQDDRGQRLSFEIGFRRKHKYWPTIQRVFLEKQVPVELGYVAFVESHFNPQPSSGAGARGVWQFMPETGKDYELLRSEDFYDIEKSTLAAATYLRRLINYFGSHLLAAAAYNTGEGNVWKCLAKIESPGNRNFWGIRECLAKETREYVPKILADLVIGFDPKSFGFAVESEEEVLARYDVIVVPEVTSLARLAALAGMKPEELRKANNEIDPRNTSTPCRNFPLYVPKGAGALVAAGLAGGAGGGIPVVAPVAPVETVPRR
jgi:soluble lytic murein transglycosylase-like protein